MTFKKSVSKSIAITLIISILSISMYNLAYAEQSSKKLSNQIVENENIMGNLEEVDNLNHYSKLLTEYNLTEESISKLIQERKSYTIDTDMSKLYSDDQVKLMKLEFQIENGTEDIFKVVKKSDNLITETNGAKGLIRTTILDENGIEINNFT